MYAPAARKIQGGELGVGAYKKQRKEEKTKQSGRGKVGQNKIYRKKELIFTQKKKKNLKHIIRKGKRSG